MTTDTTDTAIYTEMGEIAAAIDGSPHPDDIPTVNGRNAAITRRRELGGLREAMGMALGHVRAARAKCTDAEGKLAAAKRQEKHLTKMWQDAIDAKRVDPAGLMVSALERDVQIATQRVSHWTDVVAERRAVMTQAQTKLEQALTEWRDLRAATAA